MPERKSIRIPIRMPELHDRGRRHALKYAWRSLLSLRDPAALTGRRGHPTDCRSGKNQTTVNQRMHSGGPAVCGALAGSRSDKKPRHEGSIAVSFAIHQGYTSRGLSWIPLARSRIRGLHAWTQIGSNSDSLARAPRSGAPHERKGTFYLFQKTRMSPLFV